MPSPRRRRWIRRGLLSVALLGSMYALRHQINRISTKPVKAKPAIERAEQHTPTSHREPIRRTPASAPTSIKIPSQPLHFSEIPKGNYCTMYARLAAEKLYNKKYVRGDAWDFARNNKSVWKGTTENPKEIATHLKPGQVIGLFNPTSKYNTAGRAYTHTALYVGLSGGEHWVMQRIGTTDRLESLEQFLSRNKGWKIRELIEPK